MREPQITINGVALNDSQAMTVRSAVTGFFVETSRSGALGKDETGEGIRKGYQARAAEVVQLMISPPPPQSHKRGTLTPEMIRDTAGWEQIEEELRVTLRQAADALEGAQKERDQFYDKWRSCWAPLTPRSENEKQGFERVLAIPSDVQRAHNDFYRGRRVAFEECATMLRAALATTEGSAE